MFTEHLRIALTMDTTHESPQGYHGLEDCSLHKGEEMRAEPPPTLHTVVRHSCTHPEGPLFLLLPVDPG